MIKIQDIVNIICCLIFLGTKCPSCKHTTHDIQGTHRKEGKSVFDT